VHTLSYQYSWPLLRRRYFRDLWQTQGGFLLSLPIAAAISIWTALDPHYWWFSGFLAGFSLAYLGLLYDNYRRMRSSLVDHQVTTVLNEAGIHFASMIGTTDMPWAAIKGVRSTKDGLLLTYEGSQRPILLPAHALTPEVTAFVTNMVRGSPGSAKDGA
jgi:hypothetical protein